jgi:hypothetical protein
MLCRKVIKSEKLFAVFFKAMGGFGIELLSNVVYGCP